MNRTLRIVVSVVLGIFALPALGFGIYFLICWARIETTDVYYVQYPYFGAALAFLTVAACSLLCGFYAAWRRSFYGLLFTVPVFLGLATMVYIPDGTPHVQRSMVADANYLSSMNAFFRVWFDANHRFPATVAEFDDALQRGPEAWQGRVQSPSAWSSYSHRDGRLPYEVVVITNASGPRMTKVSDRPGVIYYCVSSNQQEFWVTMTGLATDVARSASLTRAAEVKEAGKEYLSNKP